MANVAVEGEVMVLGLNKSRASIIPAKLTGSGVGNFEGILRADSDGLALALFNSTRFSTLLKGRARHSVKTRFLGVIDDIVDFGLAEDAVAKNEGRWWLKVTTSDKQEQTYNFKCSSIFLAVGWLQNLRKLSGRKETTVVTILGETGSGKSMLASTLSGLKRDNSIFRVDDTLESVTTNTSMCFTKWLGEEKAEEVIIIDTPGLSDSECRDDEHVADMLTKLRSLGGVHMFVILFNSENPRLYGPLEQMLATFEAAFGKKFWENTCICFSRWYSDEESQNRRSKDKEELSEEWNTALRTRFPAIRNSRRQNMDLPCFFVDSDPEESDEIKVTRSELRKLSTLARSQPLFDCRHIVPDQRAFVGMFNGSSVPEGAEELAAFLRATQMQDKLPALIANGVTTMEDLSVLKDRYLMTLFKWTAEEVARVRAANDPSTPTSSNYTVTKDFKKLGLPVEKLESAGYGASELLALTEGAVMDKLGFNLMQLVKFNEWKAKTLKGHAVTGKSISEGCIVSRHTAAWPYKDTPLSDDGRGAGMIINWRNMDGDVFGVTACPKGWIPNPRTYDAPSLPGWATVFWFATGISNTYRVGADGIHELQHESSFDAGIDGDVSNPLEAQFDFPDYDEDKPFPPSKLRCTFGFERQERPIFSMFDIRDDVCMAVANMKHGEVVRIGQGEFVVVGVAITQENGTGAPAAQMFVKGVGKAEGAMVLFKEYLEQAVHLRSMVLTCKKFDDFEEHMSDSLPNDVLFDIMESIQLEFDYPIGSTVIDPGSFDTRNEVIAKFNADLEHGDEIEFLTGTGEWKKAVVIGVRSIDGQTPSLWFHAQDDAGATGFPGIECQKSTFRKLGTKVEVRKYDWERTAFKAPRESFIKTLKLEPTLEFPVGLGVFDYELCKFDTRKEICEKFCGYGSGTVLRIGSSPKKLTVIGVFATPPNNTYNIYFHLEGTLGAGLLPNFNKIFATISAESEKADVQKLSEEVKAARSQIINQFKSLSFSFGPPPQ